MAQKFKIFLLIYFAHTHRCPSFVNHIISSVSNYPCCLWLCLFDGTDIPHINTSLVNEHSPITLEQSVLLLIHNYFKKNLKTLFRLTF